MTPIATERPNLLHAGSRAVRIPAGRSVFRGELRWPCHPSGFAILAPIGKGDPLAALQDSVAARLRDVGVGTLLLHLPLHPRPSGAARQAALSAARLRTVFGWLARQPEAAGLRLGCFGAGADAATVLEATECDSPLMSAVVVTTSRPELLEEAMVRVRTPTLLIMERRDPEALRRIRGVLHHLDEVGAMACVSGADHRPPAHETIEEMAGTAAQWFIHHLVMVPVWHGSRSGACALESPAAPSSWAPQHLDESLASRR
ncbi:MAG TPA: hypothetical protein VFU23_03825 [Gemmatimonadales bacterium]|nr:hypothetical protein [Gemmatimonadales bacterium]